VERTHYFAAPEAVFTGRVDRLDTLTAAAGGGLEIVEYKTGRAPQPHGPQSALLHLLVAATSRQHTDLRPIRSGPGLRPALRPIRVSLVHLPSGQRDTATLHREEIKQVRLRILLALRRLDAGHAPPHPGPHCRFCPFASPRWCPAHATPEPWSTLDALL
jgi:RecB family exonuclease